MFSVSNSIFGSKKITIPATAKIVFVSDMFVEDYVGGAELTSQALIDSSPHEVFRIHSKDVSMDLLETGLNKFWIFGNFTNVNPQLIPSIVANLKYAICEYDYKYCRYRSPEKHQDAEGILCNCPNEMQGKVISALFHGAKALFWMSEKQMERYHTAFPFLNDAANIVLSSVFDDKFFANIKSLRTAYENTSRKGWIVLGSPSWIKGMNDAEKWCKDNNKDYEVVWNLPYAQLLSKLAQAEGFVYLPKGGDTCPRMVIEAKLLGCELKLNENVQHASEDWFVGDMLTMESYLYAARQLFWNNINHAMNKKPTISGYTTTYNCITQDYPFIESIKSMLAFCDEVCVVDGGSKDGTWEQLQELVADNMTRMQPPTNKLKIKQVPRDWSHPRFAVFDGMQKAEARKMCTSDFCWQMDSDEIVHEVDAPKIKTLVDSFPPQADILCLPVIEYWGGTDKVRLDVAPWKWRLSRNKSNITHGIPMSLRKYDAEGNLYAAQGTDGCDMIDAASGNVIPHMTFYTPEIDNARQFAMNDHKQAKADYQTWFDNTVANLPGVFHFSWYNLPRKIRTYKNYWSSHWKALFDIEKEDTAENNMMFNLPWSEVTDEMIEARAKEMKEKLGGWVWHQKWDGMVTTPHITSKRTVPAIMADWLKKNS